MDELVKRLIAAGVRAVLQGLAGYLLAKGLLEPDEVAGWVDQGTALITAAVFFFVSTVGWSFLEKISAEFRTRIVAEFAEAAVTVEVDPSNGSAVTKSALTPEELSEIAARTDRAASISEKFAKTRPRS